MASGAEAEEKVRWYLCRWQIEVHFRILKSGCKVEQLQLQTRDRLEVALAFYMIIAWRVLYLAMLGRRSPICPVKRSLPPKSGERSASWSRRRSRPSLLHPSGKCYP